MEAKKQFIIVPPMTEPLVKLNETYEALSEKENLEITIIDDYLELSQYASFAGQCLIVFGNPKKCAHFLQENKNLISKNKPKILLISPMDIPAATKEKFNKVGLTESLVDSIPFKNLQFKVNMLLKSIKNTDNEGPNKTQKEQLVKSIVDTNHINSSEKLEVKSKSSLDNLSGRSSYKEEKIETHWSGQRNKKESEIDKIEEGSLKVKSIEQKEKKDSESKPLVKSTEKLKVLAPESSKTIDNKIGINENSTHTKETIKSNPIKSDIPENKSLDKKTEKLSVIASEKNTTNAPDKNKNESPLTSEAIKQTNPRRNDEIENKVILKAENNEVPSTTKKIDSIKLVVEHTHTKNNSVQKEVNSKELGRKIDIENAEVPLHKEIKLKSSEAEKPETQKRNSKVDAPKDVESKLPLRRTNEQQAPEDQEAKIKTKIDEMIDGKLRSKKDGTVDKIDKDHLGDYTFLDKTIAPTKEIVLKETKSVDPKPEDKKSSELNSVGEEKSPNKKKAPNILLTVLKKLGIAKKNPAEDVQSTSIQIKDSANPTSAPLPLVLKNNQIEDKPHPEKNKNSAIKNEFQKTSRTQQSQEVDHIDMYYRGHKNTEDHSEKKSKESRKNVLEIEKKSSKRDESNTTNKKEKIIPEDLIIDYRQLKADFIASATEEKQNQFKKTKETILNQEIDAISINDKPIYEVHSKGLDFSISMLNLVCDRNLSHESLFRHISQELTKQYKGYATFYQFQKTENHYQEIFSSFKKEEIPHLGQEQVYWFNNTLNNEAEKNRLFTMTNTLWFCRELKNKESSNFWEDNELPNWASTELINKKVELYFPYFDGVDLLGCVLLYFPSGINSSEQHSILLTIEIAKSIFLDLMKKDSIEQSINLALHELELEKEKKKLVGKITSILKKNKAS